MPHNEFVQNFIKIIGPFYEYVDDNGNLINENDDNQVDHDGEYLENEEREEKIEEKELNNNIKHKSYAKNEINGSIPIKNANNQSNKQNNLNSNGFFNGLHTNGHNLSHNTEACSGNLALFQVLTQIEQWINTF